MVDGARTLAVVVFSGEAAETATPWVAVPRVVEGVVVEGRVVEGVVEGRVVDLEGPSPCPAVLLSAGTLVLLAVVAVVAVLLGAGTPVLLAVVAVVLVGVSVAPVVARVVADASSVVVTSVLPAVTAAVDAAVAVVEVVVVVVAGVVVVVLAVPVVAVVVVVVPVGVTAVAMVPVVVVVSVIFSRVGFIAQGRRPISGNGRSSACLVRQDGPHAIMALFLFDNPASWNMFACVRTCVTSHLDTSWLNLAAPCIIKGNVAALYSINGHCRAHPHFMLLCGGFPYT